MAQVEFPLPTLTVGGELDGLCRLTRITEALYSQVTFSENATAATRSMPVTVVEGMNHMQFASGEPPFLVKQRDLMPEIAEDEVCSVPRVGGGVLCANVCVCARRSQGEQHMASHL